MSANQYYIKDLENLTSIKAHTLRIWEQRYMLLSPSRTKTNIRYYSDEDVKKILNINILYKNGWKVSKISKLSPLELIEQASILVQSKSENSDLIVNSLIEAIISFSNEACNTILNHHFDEKGLLELYKKIISPTLTQIGHLWLTGTMSVAHEHFFSNLLKVFILSKTYTIKPVNKFQKKALFFLNEFEQHEIPLLIKYYHLKSIGIDCIYLGQNVPLSDLESSIESVKPDMILSSFISNINDEKRTVLNKIISNNNHILFLITGNSKITSHFIKSNSNVNCFNSINEFEKYNFV